MTDRELLEAAAKAAGHPLRITWPAKACPCGSNMRGACLDRAMSETYVGSGCEWQVDPQKVPESLRQWTHRPSRWNPLADDGDALRLAVKLRLEIAHLEGGGTDVTVWREGAMFGDPYSEIGQDPYAATRRAIVRAAAAMAEVRA